MVNSMFQNTIEICGEVPTTEPALGLYRCTDLAWTWSGDRGESADMARKPESSNISSSIAVG
jgi:hypothetical protein